MNNNLAVYMIKQIQKLKKENRNFKNLLIEKSNFKELLTVSEACELFGFSEKTFYRYRADGLKVTQLRPNSKIFVKKIDVEKYLNKKNGR